MVRFHFILRNSAAMSDSFYIRASVGLVVSLLFLVLEILLLPLFELVREKLSITCVRHVLNRGFIIYLRREQPLLSWFGLADGISVRNKYLQLTRLLKTAVKLFIVASPFFF